MAALTEEVRSGASSVHLLCVLQKDVRLRLPWFARSKWATQPTRQHPPLARRKPTFDATLRLTRPNRN